MMCVCSFNIYVLKQNYFQKLGSNACMPTISALSRLTEDLLSSRLVKTTSPHLIKKKKEVGGGALVRWLIV